MIKYGLFLVSVGFIIYEGVYAHPSSKRNDTRLSSIYTNPKNIARRSMYYDEDYKKKSDSKSDSSKENSLESVVVAINTGVKKYLTSKNKPDLRPDDVVDNLAKTLVDFAKSASNPVYIRSMGEEYNIRPEVIRIKDEKPSVLLEIDSKSIVNGLKELLRSKTVNKLMENFSKEAAMVYRNIQSELVKDKYNNRGEKQ